MAGEATASLYPEASALLEDLSDLLALSPPPFLYVHDPTTPRRTNSAIDALLTELSSSDKTLRHASLDAISCFSARIFYDTTINALTHHEPTWESGAANWGTERYNESLDAFLHGIRAAANHVAEEEEGRLEDVQMVLLVENAERMKDATPELLVPLARLYELVSS
jgi:origin recognition complex subunit 5